MDEALGSPPQKRLCANGQTGKNMATSRWGYLPPLHDSRLQPEEFGLLPRVPQFSDAGSHQTELNTAISGFEWEDIQQPPGPTPVLHQDPGQSESIDDDEVVCFGVVSSLLKSFIAF